MIYQRRGFSSGSDLEKHCRHCRLYNVYQKVESCVLCCDTSPLPWPRDPKATRQLYPLQRPLLENTCRKEPGQHSVSKEVKGWPPVCIDSTTSVIDHEESEHPGRWTTVTASGKTSSGPITVLPGWLGYFHWRSRRPIPSRKPENRLSLIVSD